MCSEKDIRPHHTTEKERETQQQTNGWGGFWLCDTRLGALALRYQTGDKTTPCHGEREVDPVGNQRVGGALAMRYQTWGLWLCDTRLGARPHHTEKGGEGGFWLSDTRQGVDSWTRR